MALAVPKRSIKIRNTAQLESLAPFEKNVIEIIAPIPIHNFKMEPHIANSTFEIPISSKIKLEML